MLNEYKMIVPVSGSVQLSVCAEDAAEAINILIEKQPDLEALPYGHLEMELSKIIVIENKINDRN